MKITEVMAQQSDKRHRKESKGYFKSISGTTEDYNQEEVIFEQSSTNKYSVIIAVGWARESAFLLVNFSSVQ